MDGVSTDPPGLYDPMFVRAQCAHPRRTHFGMAEKFKGTGPDLSNEDRSDGRVVKDDLDLD